MQFVFDVLKLIPPIVEFAADFVTTIVGAVGIWGLLFKRRELLLAFRVLTNTYFNYRTSHLRESLLQLENLSWNNRENRPEIQALIGRICGQLKPLTQDFPELESVLEELENLKTITERRKQTIVHSILGQLESLSFRQQTSVMKSKQ